MRLLDQWKVRGPARTIRSELAEWDLVKEQWQDPRRVTMAEFRPDGCISEMVNHNPNGSISRSRYRYDEAGRLLESISQLDDGPIGKTGYRYDESGRLVRKIFVDGKPTTRPVVATRPQLDDLVIKTLHFSSGHLRLGV
jgi:hypothetical protein